MLILMVTLRFSIDVPSEASAQSLREKLVAAHDRSFPLPSGSPRTMGHKWVDDGGSENYCKALITTISYLQLATNQNSYTHLYTTKLNVPKLSGARCLNKA